MNRKTLSLAAIAIVPVFLMLIVSGLNIMPDAEASAKQVTYQYGIRTQGIVCGDHLCNEHKTVTAVVPENIQTAKQVHDHLPEIEIVEVHNFSNSDENAYVLTLKVTAGNQNIENISVQVQSDVTSVDTAVSSISADDEQVVVVRTHAMDPSSIHASVKAYHISE